MLKQTYKLLLSPRGRIGRVLFCLGIVGLSLIWALQHYVIFPQFENTLTGFYIALFMFFFTLHIIYCVCGKRLHDLGRSNWALIGMFTVLFIAMVAIMLKFGGLEYFETVMQNPDKKDDLAFVEQTRLTYEKKLEAHLPQSGLLMSIVPSLFGLWLALTPGQKTSNRYGEPLG